MNDPNLRRALSTLADEVRPVDLEPGVRRARHRIRTRRATTAGLAALAVLATTAGTYAVVTRPRAAVAPQSSATASPTAPASPTPSTPSTPPTSEPLSACVTHMKSTLLTLPASALQLAIDTKFAYDTTVTDPSGRYVAGNNVLWTDGTPSVIPIPDPTYAVATAINVHGDVVGDTPKHAWLYHAGNLTMLAGISGYTMRPDAINASGDISGIATPSPTTVDIIAGVGAVGVIWPAGHPDEIRRLHSPSGWPVDNAVITDDGTIVGSIGIASEFTDTYKAVIWKDGGSGDPQPLNTPGTAMWTQTISVSGPWVAGYMRVAAPGVVGGKFELIRWNLDTGAYTAYPNNGSPNGVLPPKGVDRFGDLLVHDGDEPVLLRSDGRFTLPMPTGYGQLQILPTSMSDDGHVIIGWIGGGSRLQSVPQYAVGPVEWHC